MNPDDFEKQLARQTLRALPGDWREEVLRAAKTVSPATKTSRRAPSWLSVLNARLAAIFWPNPAAWAGLAAVWVVILAVNDSTVDRSELMAKRPTWHAPEIFLAMQQQREVTRQTEAVEMPPAEEPKPFVPRPRGELRTRIILI